MRRSSLPLLVGCFGLLAACTTPPTLTGKVTDLYNKPLVGAKVTVGELGTHLTTDARGEFSIEVEYGAQLGLRAGLDGYIPDATKVTIPGAEGEALPTPTFKLWPNPAEPGFYGVGASEILHLEGAKVVSLGSELKELHGIRDLPRSTVITGKEGSSFLFRSTLRSSEIKRLDLKLTQLDFIEDTTLPGLTGDQTIEADIWVGKASVPFVLRSLDAENMYIVTTEKKLEPGSYAFQSQSILSETEPGSLARFPNEMQVVHAFTVK